MQKLPKLVLSFLLSRFWAVVWIITFFVTIPVSNLTNLLFNVFLPTKIICYVDSKGQNIRSTNIRVLLITFLPPIFLFLLPSFIRALYCSREIARWLRLLVFWLKLFGFRVFISFFQTGMYKSIFIIIILIYVTARTLLHFGLCLNSNSLSNPFFPTI